MTQPAKSRTGLWIAIGGAALALLLICCAGGVVAFLALRDRGDEILSPPPASPSASRSAAASDLASCIIGSWRYQHPGLTAVSLHGSPALDWKSDRGESLLSFTRSGSARVEESVELVARDTAGAEHRYKKSGGASFTYQLAGSTISYGPVTSTGKSAYFVNGAQQGEPRDQALWLPNPERIDCVPGTKITLSGVNEGVPYSQDLTFKQ